MDTLAKNKGILGLVAIFVVVMFVYNIFVEQSTEPTESELSVSTIGDNLVKIQTELQAVTLNREIFSSNEYLLLEDFGTSIQQQPTGRANPFGAIGQ